MNDSRFKARSQRLVDFGVLCNQIVLPSRAHVPKSLISKLVRFRLPLTAMRDDPQLRKVADNRLKVLGYLHSYATELNKGNDKLAQTYRDKAIAEHKKGDKLVNRLADKRGDAHGV